MRKERFYDRLKISKFTLLRTKENFSLVMLINGQNSMTISTGLSVKKKRTFDLCNA